MESLKPILLCIVLGGIGYLVYVALNRAPPSEPALDAAPPWNQPAKVGPSQQQPATESRSAGPSGSSDLVVPPGGNAPSGNAPTSLLPFAGGNSLVSPPPSAPSSSPVSPPTSPPSFPSPSSLAPPPVASSPPSAPSMPSLISPGQSPPSRPAAETPPISTGAVPPLANSNSPPSNVAADLEMAKQRHDFESAMRRAQVDIQQNKLVDALSGLSPWYDHTAVPAERTRELDELLSQLAGTVIYSREHYLQQPHVVRAGETLEQIAELQQVPWQLLAKINGIDDPKSLVAGEQLKVVRGPFDAQLNRTRNQLALFVNNLYAGRFDIQTAGDVAQIDGKFPVTKFAAEHPSNSLRQKYISLGGNLFLRLPDGGVTPQAGTMHIGKRDLDDVFDILSDRSQVTIRR